MPGQAKPIPDGFHTLTPYLVVKDAAKAIDFYTRAFGAEVRHVHNTPDGRIMHAELKIGDSMLMLNDEFPEMGVLSPVSLGGQTSVTIHMYIEDVDKVFNQAVAAGATVKFPIMDAFWGDRFGQLVDPFGHPWSLATRKQDLTPEELAQAGAEAIAKISQGGAHS